MTATPTPADEPAPRGRYAVFTLLHGDGTAAGLAPTPPGSLQHRSYTPVPAAYRRGTPPFDRLERADFDDLAAAQAWQAAQQELSRGDATAATLLTGRHAVREGLPPAGALVQVELLRRAPGMAKADFLHHWQAVHGPLAARIGGVLRYHQFPAADDGTHGSAWDGLALLWFADWDSLRASAADPAYAATRADLDRFTDTAACRSVSTQAA